MHDRDQPPSAAVLVRPGGGEVVADAPDRHVEILCERDALHATRSRFGPRRDGADLHIHRRQTDLFYVLAGELTVRLGVEDRVVAVPAGTLARVPAFVVHGFRNGTGGELCYLNFHAPGEGFAAYLRSLRDARPVAYDQEPPPARGTRPPTEAAIGATGVVAEEHGLRRALLADVEAIAIAEADSDPGDPQPHIHDRHTESVYVLDGRLTISTGGRDRLATAGTWVDLPAGVPHAVHGAARYLEIHAPGCGYGEHLRTGAAFDQRPAQPGIRAAGTATARPGHGDRRAPGGCRGADAQSA